MMTISAKTRNPAPRGVAFADQAATSGAAANHQGLAPGRDGRVEFHEGASGSLNVDRSIALGERLITAVEAFCEALALQFDLPDLGDIELPPIAVPAADQANLRAMAPLYFAAELEEARLLPAVEAFAGLFAGGGLQSDPGAASPLIAEFWRGRRERFNETERRAIFARLFGYKGGPALASHPASAGSNAAFETLMISLGEGLAREDPDEPHNDLQIRMSARQLAANLMARGGGVASFAARDLLNAIKAALEILKRPEVQHAVGASSAWIAVRNIAEMYLNEQVEINAHVVRGKAGMLMLAWLAESLPKLEETETPLVHPGDQVVGAALAWIQSSLDLAEQDSHAHGRAA